MKKQSKYTTEKWALAGGTTGAIIGLAKGGSIGVALFGTAIGMPLLSSS